MINQCPPIFKEKILDLFNKIWTTGNIRKQFKHAIIIPTHKPGKDPKDPASYRPISLTSHLGKTLESIINKRLNYYLETKQLINKNQAGFRKNRQTIDQIIALDNAIKTARANNKAACAILLDLEKAYDTMWQDGLLKNLKKMNIKGKMYNYIMNFGQDTTFQVRVGGSLSSTQKQENGTPQGAVISPTLFNIAINDLNSKITDHNTQLSQCSLEDLEQNQT
ncbi:reverse transcriptase [Elysia marginata]|uniref:Reverse transcriptase n=1 Tax=Elysia marginata TaxID=1093978 RepID=A0AAV4JP05_9GAST|nr:reverse transcriptase [Elysia marginata]